jgi:hypothetical protein
VVNLSAKNRRGSFLLFHGNPAEHKGAEMEKSVTKGRE